MKKERVDLHDIHSVAASNSVDCIVTRNCGDFEENEIPCYSPAEFVNIFAAEK